MRGHNKHLCGLGSEACLNVPCLRCEAFCVFAGVTGVNPLPYAPAWCRHAAMHQSDVKHLRTRLSKNASHTFLSSPPASPQDSPTKYGNFLPQMDFFYCLKCKLTTIWTETHRCQKSSSIHCRVRERVRDSSLSILIGNLKPNWSHEKTSIIASKQLQLSRCSWPSHTMQHLTALKGHARRQRRGIHGSESSGRC